MSEENFNTENGTNEQTYSQPRIVGAVSLSSLEYSYYY